MTNPLILPKTVKKPWGDEVWIADGERTPYALKKITFLAGNQSSLHVHRYKFETNFVLSGTGVIQLSKRVIDTQLLSDPNARNSITSDVLKDLIEYRIEAGNIVDVPPGIVHRVIAETDLVFIEASTPELEDVFRLLDDSHRSDGKIDSEHQ